MSPAKLLNSQKQSAFSVNIPDDLVPVGYITGAFGVQGWVRVKPYSADASALLHARRWWLDKPELHDVDMRQSKMHVDEVVAQLVGVDDRDGAEALKGTLVQISRRHFPVPENNEFYWIDLIGLSVENLQGEHLGTVNGLMESGAHPILRVSVHATPGLEAQQREILIPFVDQFVITVDMTVKLIKVDWQLDY